MPQNKPGTLFAPGPFGMPQDPQEVGVGRGLGERLHFKRKEEGELRPWAPTRGQGELNGLTRGLENPARGSSQAEQM